MAKLLSVQNLNKSFLFEGQKVLVLKDISLEVEEKEFVSIIGPSGCGKSTLLELLSGITKPDSGKIFYREQDVTGQAGKAGYMPQDDLLFPWLTLLDNVLLPCKIKHTDISVSRQKALNLLPDFGLEGYAQHLPWQLSGGMKQRAAFLRTVMSEADILLLDEPFANLDALTRLQMQGWLHGIRKKLGLTIVLVTHDIDEAIRLADVIYVMDSNPGTLIYKEKVPEVLHQDGNDVTHPLWSKLKTRLLHKLLP
ncbi:MAG TPA: ABC transporter ATP-binding protein [Candidatus Cloacimonadota bacterium]|nr:ABC transporter ATP-binding protein [Candidatus Cloacimonadota bacterium]HQL14834.1 ABC transporter ATP-binding protein [Candidatus Cloacimonadota bacterium]